MKITLNLFKKISAISAILLIMGMPIYPRLVMAQGTPQFLTGDLMVATNNTSGNGSWSDPVNGLPGEVIEFNILAQNMSTDSTATANNVVVKANLQSTPATTLTASTTISADNASQVSDNATVNVSGGTLQSLVYLTGQSHTRIVSKTCPSGCIVADTVTTSGINVGNLGSGESAQVMFKVYISNNVTPTPTPTVTVTPTPTGVPTATPTPTVTVTPTPTVTVTPTGVPTATPTPGEGNTTFQCPTANGGTVNVTVSNSSAANFNCNSVIVNVTNTSNSSSSATGGSVTIAAAALTPTPGAQVESVKELPKTGLPIEAWGLSGMLPIGFGLKKFVSDKNSAVKTTANFIWQQREFLKK